MFPPKLGMVSVAIGKSSDEDVKGEHALKTTFFNSNILPLSLRIKNLRNRPKIFTSNEGSYI